MTDLSAQDPKKQICNELAQALGSDDSVRMLRLLQMTNFLAQPPSPPQPPGPRQPGAEDGPRPIDVWQPQEVDGELAFVRPDPPLMGDYRSTRKVLKVKTSETPRRICFLGESAAAGYFYAPHLTPARVLAEQLAFLEGADAFEVIDLARANEDLQSLAATLESALQLEPDVLVIFMGNNWNLLESQLFSPYIPSVQVRQLFGQGLRQAGLWGPIEGARRQLAQKVSAVLGKVAALAEKAQAKVILVAPEINLADWENRQPVSWLPGDGVARWYEAYERAIELLDQESYQEAAEAAQEMIRLDQGSCPTPHRILARAYLGLGEVEKAAEASVREVDSLFYPNLCFMSAPQVNSLARDLIRKEAQKHGFDCVDLRPVFAEHVGSALPGRRMFLDYCHMTAEGMKVAMSAVAVAVAGANGSRDPEVSWRSLVEQSPDPDVAPQAHALAALGAASHSAHRLLTTSPKSSILEWWCSQALEASETAAEMMMDFVSARLAPGPAVVTKAQQRNLESSYHFQLQHGWRYSYLDVEMIDAIRAVLERAGHEAAEKIVELLVEHQGLRPEGVDLVHPAFLLWEPIARFYPDFLGFRDMTARACYRAPWRDSEFCLVCDGSQAVELSVTARLPAINGIVVEREGRLELSVNGDAIGHLDACQSWSRKKLEIPTEKLRKGINRLSLRWPLPPAVGEEALASAVKRLETGLEADLHPVFGELYSLVARPC